MFYNRTGNALSLFAALFVVVTNQQAWAQEKSDAASPNSTGLKSIAALAPINPAGTSAQDQLKTTTPNQSQAPQTETSIQSLTVVDLPQVYRDLAQDAADVTAALNHRRAGICRRLRSPHAATRPCRRRRHRRDGATAAASATGIRRGAAA
jgi:hypothetical protein